LANLVAEAQGPAALRHAIHPATRTFQALRIHVNDELGELARGLAAALVLLKPEGRLAVVSFHSLEDRIVKQFFIEQGGSAPRASRHLPQPGRGKAALRVITSRPQTPTPVEIAANPRARSAKLRVAERLAA
jgi:16S rRNA (cytosine1402-N4)-methyltransferase